MVDATTPRDDRPAVITPISIEFLGVFGLPPVEHVKLAAELGCRHVSLLPEPLPYNPHGYLPFSLRWDAMLRRELIAVLRDLGVSVSLGEGFALQPGVGADAFVADLDVMRELGAERINVVSFDRDVACTLDQIARLAEMADAVGIETMVETGMGSSIRGLAGAVAAVRHAGRASCRVLIDTMHFVRSGGTAADLAALDPALIGYIQLCDVPLVSTHPTYMEEALYERRVPGAGELPLHALLAALPRDRVIGLEIPQRSLAQAGVPPRDRLAPCVAATRALLAAVDAAALRSAS